MADRTVKVRITGDASGLTAALASAQAKTQAFAKSLTAASKSAQWNTVSTGLMAVGGTLTAVGVKAVQMGADFEEAMSHVASTGDDARANIDALRQVALDMGAKTKYSATEAAQGITELAKAGMSSADIIGGGLAAALSLAATEDMELGDAAERTAQAMAQFNLSGSEAGQVADTIAAGAGKAVGSVQDMSEALNNVGSVASQMGMSLQETTGTLAIFAQNGIVGAEAGTQLKSMLMKLMAPSSAAQKTMDELGISVYDSSGKFVGMAGVAEQLKVKMSGLSEEERNAALATIFGSRAVQGASILYKQGAAGVQEWTAAVTDKGYAEEMAAEKTNNLKGDIEKLGGAFETAMIQIGNMGQGPLRSFVQSITEVVEKVSSSSTAINALGVVFLGIGPAILAAGVAMKAFTAAHAACVAVMDAARFFKVTDAIHNMKAGWDGLTASTKKAALGYSALMVATVAVGQAIDEMNTNTEEINQAMSSMADGTTNAQQALHAVSEAAGEAQLSIGGKSGLAWALQEASDPGPLDGFMRIAGGIVGLETTSQKAETHVKTLDQALAKMVNESPAQAAQAFHELGSYISEAGLSADQVVGQFGATAEALRQQAQAAGVASISNQELAQWMSTGIAPAAVQAGQAANGVAAANEKMAASAEEAGMSTEEYASTLSSLAEAMSEAAGIAISASEAMNDFHEAIANGNEALSQNGANLDRNTEAGRANWDALNELASSHLKLREAMVEEGASLDEINAKTQEGREAFISLAQGMGMSAEEANSWADRMGFGTMTMEQLNQAASEAGTTVQGTADNFEYMGRKAGISAEEMSRLRQANEAGAQALDTTAQRAISVRDQMVQMGSSMTDVVNATNSSRDAFINQAIQMGLSKEQAASMADAYGLFQMNLDTSTEAVNRGRDSLQQWGQQAGLSQQAMDMLKNSTDQEVAAVMAFKDQHRQLNEAMSSGAMSAEQGRAAQESLRASFIESQVAAGMERSEAESLADAIGLVPGESTTNYTNHGTMRQGEGEAKDNKSAIESIPQLWETFANTISDLSGVQAVKNALATLVDKTVTITTVHRTIEHNSVSKMGEAVGKARGGYITGPGTGTSDSIPAWLSNGEFVIRAAAVRKYGLAMLEAINGMAYSGDGRHFATGGLVQYPQNETRYVYHVAPQGSGTTINVSPQVITEKEFQRYLVRAVEDVTARTVGKAYRG